MDGFINYEINIDELRNKDISCGFSGYNPRYVDSKIKDEFLNKIDDFCNKEFDKPVFFEVFTTNEDEMTAYNTMKTIKQKGEQK